MRDVEKKRNDHQMERSGLVLPKVDPLKSSSHKNTGFESSEHQKGISFGKRENESEK